MAKTKSPTMVPITYDLFGLPTAQHKAGLAGLLLQIGSMKNRRIIAPSYRWDEEYPNTKVHIEFTEETTKSLFDDYYDATYVEGAPREKPFYKGKGPNKEEIPAVRRQTFTKTDKKGNEKSIEGYVYLELNPALSTLRQYLPSTPKAEWVRLWQDLIWQVIRDSKKKAPYIQRAASKIPPEGASTEDADECDESEKETDEKGSADGSKWVDLIKFHQALKKNTVAVGKLNSALLLGAQADNAESISFKGRIDQNLLLHFWPITSMVYVPKFIDRDGKSHIGRRDKDDRSKHFCLAVPDLKDLPQFIDEYRKVLATLSTEIEVYRPKESLIDLAAEGGLSFVDHLARLTPQAASMLETRYSVSGIDYMHLNKDGNNVRFLSTGRVSCNPYLVEEYRAILGRPGEKAPYTNPFFRRSLMIALLENKAWFQPFGKLFQERPAEFFVLSDKSPKNLAWFWADARNKLWEVQQSMPDNPTDDPPNDEDILATTINRFIRRYLDLRLKKDAGHDFEKFRKDKSTPPKAAEDRRKLAERLFLEFRSRRDQAFIDHFSGTFFAVGQYMGNKPVPRLFERVAEALMYKTEDVKTLTLMALSANGWVYTPKKETAE